MPKSSAKRNGKVECIFKEVKVEDEIYYSDRILNLINGRKLAKMSIVDLSNYKCEIEDQLLILKLIDEKDAKFDAASTMIDTLEMEMDMVNNTLDAKVMAQYKDEEKGEATVPGAIVREGWQFLIDDEKRHLARMGHPVAESEDARLQGSSKKPRV